MMYRQCTKCKKKVPFNEKCECELKDKKNYKNNYQKSYYEDNKEQTKLINNAKWRRLRMLIIKRDGGYCQRCFVKYKMFITENLQVHHIKPRIDFPELVYDHKNLITLCKRCNMELGTNPELDFEIEIKDIDYKL